jgi:hypothetical protein
VISTEKNLSESELLEIYRMKATAHYSLWDERSSEKSFREILTIDRNYNLDSTKTSPKIVAFFNQLKQNFNIQPKEKISKNKKIDIDSILALEKIKRENPISGHRESLTRYLILPGWGHLYLNENTKGWILTSISSAALISTIYFIFDAQQKEKDYLSSTQTTTINELYERYNFSYRMRNISLITYAVLWLYAQADLLFFSGDDMKITLSNRLSYNYGRDVFICLNYHFKF